MANKRIFVSLPYREEFRDIFAAIEAAVRLTEDWTGKSIELGRADRITASEEIREVIAHVVNRAHLVIADMGTGDPKVGIEVGIAEALHKPVIYIGEEDTFLPTLATRYTILYNRKRLTRTFVQPLARVIEEALQEPQDLTPEGRREEASSVPKAFISYSHADQESLQRLLVHLRPLQKTGKLDV